MICGINVPVVKAHGSSDAEGFYHGIRRIRGLIESNLISKVISLLPKKEETSEEN